MSKQLDIQQKVESERLYNLVLGFVEKEHGSESAHYAEMRNYVPKALRDDRQKGKSLHPAENVQVA